MSTISSLSKNPYSIARRIQGAALGVGLILLPSLLILLILTGRPASLDFAFNPFAVVSAASSLITLIALALILRVKTQTNTIFWFVLQLFGLSAWAGIEALTRFAATPEAAVFWSPMTTLSSVFVPITLYMFALSYTDSNRSQRPLVFLVLCCTSMLFIFAATRTSLIRGYDPALMIFSPWGWTAPPGPLYGLIAGWIVILCTAAVALLINYRRTLVDPMMRRQSKIFILGIAVPLVAAGVNDGLLTSLGFHTLPVIGLSAMVTGLIITYGILRYRIFNFAPELIAPQILATMNEAVIGVQEDLSISYVNRGAERLLGYPASKLTGQKFGSFLAARLTLPQARHALLSPLEQTDFYTHDATEFSTAEGKTITTKLSITKIVTQGAPDTFIFVLTDITAIAQAQVMIERQVAVQTKTIRETKARLVSSMNSLQFGFIITDDRPEIIMYNHASHALVCGSRKHTPEMCDKAGMPFLISQFDQSAQLEKVIRSSLRTKKPRSIAAVGLRQRTMRVFVSPVIDGDKATGTAIIIQDITEEQILNRSRDEFFSIASHELRTPLTAIKGNTSMMLNYYSKALKDPSLKEMVNDVHDSSVRLIEIVNDFLDVSRLEQGRVTYHFEEVTVIKLIEQVVYEMGASAKQRGIYLRVGDKVARSDALPQVIADPGRVKQILYNLIGNAAKFTEQGGITIDAFAENSHVKITITDTGRGIAPEMQALLFRKFQQAGKSLITRDGAKGTGLGLYISRLLAEGMDGAVTLDRSEPNVGSTFSMTIPISTPARLARLQQAPITTTDAQSGQTVKKS